MLRVSALGAGLVLACVFVTVYAHGEISPDRLAAAVTPKPAWAETDVLADHAARVAAAERIVQEQSVKPAAGDDAGRARTASNEVSRLPFGGSSAGAAQPDKVTESTRPAREKKSSGAKTRSATERPPLVKPSRERSIPAPGSIGGQASDFNRPAGQAPRPSALGFSHEDYTSMPRQTAPAAPGSPAARPAPTVLPPAMPYVDPGAATATSPRTSTALQRPSRTSPQPVVPDEKGYVTARVPASPDKSHWGSPVPPQADSPLARQYTAPAPPPAGGRDSVGKFVLESFRGPEASRTGAPTPQQPAASRGPASV
ncbi:MAG: hypothetical protein LDL33_07495, partial [Desulfomonile sp.]|nr:hypothetical protein [Desulfomonile sp.]